MPDNTQSTPELSSRLKKTNEELKDLQHLVKTASRQ